MDAKDIQNLSEAYNGIYSSPEFLSEGEKWIQKAIKKPGALHKQLGVPAGEKIPSKQLAAAAKKGGKMGKRARLAQTLKGLHKEDCDLHEISADTALAASKEAGRRAGVYAGLSAGDPKVKAKAVKKREQSERLYKLQAKKRTAKVTQEDLDIYDIILSHLLDEGYASSVESAEVIMVNMSEDWRNSILG